MRIKMKLANDLTAVAEGVRFTPLFPAVDGMVIDFVDEVSRTPFFVKGSHSSQAVFYGTCPDDAKLPTEVETVSEELYKKAFRDIQYRLPHREGWVFNEDTLAWVPPAPYPTDGGAYEWDEENQTWNKVG